MQNNLGSLYKIRHNIMEGKAIFRSLTVVHEVDLGLNSVLSRLNCLLASASSTRGCFPTCLKGRVQHYSHIYFYLLLVPAGCSDILILCKAYLVPKLFSLAMLQLEDLG